MKKVDRHNHPLMVNARRESYWAGRKDGYEDGYKKGYEQCNDNLAHYYEIIIAMLEKRLNKMNEAMEILKRRIGEDK